MEHLIKLTLQGGDEITTRTNGSEEEIYNHYRMNNRMSQSNQIRRLEFVKSPLLANKLSLVYLFIDYNGDGILQ